MVWINDLIRHAQSNRVPISESLSEFRTRFSYQSRLIALQLVYRVVMADQIFAKSEASIIEEIVRRLEIRDMDHQSIRAYFKVDSSEVDHYAILGVSRNASADEIKKAYRKACKDHHPDRVHHLGPEIKKSAEKKMRQINESYAVLRR